MKSSPKKKPVRRARRGPLAWLFCAAGCLLVPDLVDAQADSATVVAGPEYRAGRLERALLGSDYRDLWTTPVRAGVLDLSTFAGGLTPVRRGGFKQTRALRLRGADGREYNFRSVNKDVTAGLPPYAQGTLADRLWQDQTRALHPAGAVVATALLDAAGVLNPGPRLVVMPDDPRLGEFRAEFAGMLGTIEVHPEEGEDGAPSFAGAERVAGTERVLEHLEEDADHRVHSREFLKARLMDVFLGDWDRHGGQWRWARFDSAGVKWWRPVPEDRDYALVDYDGLLPSLARASVAPRLVSFQADYPPMGAMLANSSELTRRLLADLPLAAWDSTAAWLRGRLTDAVIDGAVARMPAPYAALHGRQLAAALRARRDALPEAARDLYALVATVPETHGTDGRDVLEAEHLADGGLRVLLRAEDAPAGAPPHLERTFHPGVTEEVRIFLHGGDDVARVRGGAGRITLRVIGGGGDDALEDRSRGPTAFYDDRGENRFVRGPRTTVSRRSYRTPQEREEAAEEAAAEAGEEEVEEDPLPDAERDWGSGSSLFTPWADTRPHAGVVVGGGPAWTHFGFRREPYHWQRNLRAIYAPLENRFGVEYESDHRAEASPRRTETRLHASNLVATRFHGFGNDAVEVEGGASLVWERRVEGELRWVFPFGRAELSVGPNAAYVDPGPPPGSPAAALSSRFTGSTTMLGAGAELEVDARDDEVFPRHGFRLRAGTAGFAADQGAFGRAGGTASAYLSAPGGGPVLALRAGGEHAFGEYPLFGAAFLGGSRMLRGYPYQRFAGDAAAFGGAELRLPLFRAEIFVRGTVGATGFADAGRVWVDGDSPGGWHTSRGGGLWFATPLAAVGVYYADAEDGGRVLFRFGMPF